MARRHCTTIAPMEREQQADMFEKNWQTNNCGCDLQGCQQCDPFTDQEKRCDDSRKTPGEAPAASTATAGRRTRTT